MIDDSFFLDVELSEEFSMGDENVSSRKNESGEKLAVGFHSLIVDVLKRVLVNDFCFFKRNSCLELMIYCTN